MKLGLHVEIDPVPQLCVRSNLFTYTLESQMPNVLEEMERQTTGLHGGLLGSVRFSLQQKLANYLQACFGVEVPKPTDTECDLMWDAPTSTGTREGVIIKTGCTVVVQPSRNRSDGDSSDSQSLMIAASAVRKLPRNVWCGRWKSVFMVGCSTDEMVCIRGETKFHSHYYEWGGIHIWSSCGSCSQHPCRCRQRTSSG